MLAHQDGCNVGERKGQVNIATIKSYYNGDYMEGRAKLYYGSELGEYVYRHLGYLDYSQFQLYGIEWTSTTLQIFINNQVHLQANLPAVSTPIQSYA